MTMRIPFDEAVRRSLVGDGAVRSGDRDRADYAVLALDDLDYLETFTRLRNLAYLRQAWNPNLADPILLRPGDTGRFVLRNGNHRLYLARERGDETIRAVIVRRRIEDIEDEKRLRRELDTLE